MSSYAIKIQGEDGTRGPYQTPDEVRVALEEYRSSHSADPDFARLSVWEMPEHGTVGHERSVWDFVEG